VSLSRDIRFRNFGVSDDDEIAMCDEAYYNTVVPENASTLTFDESPSNDNSPTLQRVPKEKYIQDPNDYDQIFRARLPPIDLSSPKKLVSVKTDRHTSDNVPPMPEHGESNLLIDFSDNGSSQSLMHHNRPPVSTIAQPALPPAPAIVNLPPPREVPIWLRHAMRRAESRQSEILSRTLAVSRVDMAKPWWIRKR